MADIFISYASQDEHRIKFIVEALEGQGWTVWWDRKIPLGRTFDQVIEEELDAAKCIIVVWSEHSVVSEWVKNEAYEGLERRLLVPILIDEVRIPLAFRRIQAAHLTNWEGESDYTEVKLLFSTITKIIESNQVKQTSDVSIKKMLENMPQTGAISSETRRRNRQVKPIKRTRQIKNKKVHPADTSNRVMPKSAATALVQEHTLEEKVHTILKSYLPQNGLYVEPNIPMKLLANATQCSRAPSTERILGLIDCTVFGSAKNCLLFGVKGIYYNNGWTGTPSGPGAVKYEEFPNQEFRIKGLDISLGDNKSLDSSGSSVSKDTIQRILISIKEAIKEAIN